MHYQYQVAGIAVGFRLPFRLTITEESQAFLRELGEPASGFQVHFLPVPALDPPEPDGHWEVCQYHMETASERRVYHCPTPQAPPYACMIWQKIPGNQAQCQYLAGKEEYLAYSRNICDLIGLEALLHQNQGLLLHASFIRWQGSGILFSAPSGTGKSTQANLWVQHQGAEVINGDRAALRQVGGRWQAFGLPYAGSSGVYRNESVPISALVVLRQGKENRLRSLTRGEAFARLFQRLPFTAGIRTLSKTPWTRSSPPWTPSLCTSWNAALTGKRWNSSGNKCNRSSRLPPRRRGAASWTHRRKEPRSGNHPGGCATIL